jgi:hypothetical protein
MPIAPDIKDWTWVLGRPCPECGYDAAAIEFSSIGGRIRRNAASWQQLLAAGEAARARPSEDRWSTLEYGCHVRDVFRIFDRRLQLMLDEDDPGFPNWDQDETAVRDRYGEQDPETVAGELVAASAALADRVDGVSPSQLHRCGTRSDGARFDVEGLGRYLLHDAVHHLHDVGAG